MTTLKKPGFGGQWIEIFSTGTHFDDAGRKHEIDVAFLDGTVSNLNLELHEPPAVIGHPKDDDPAYGWVCGLRRNGDILEAQLCDTDPQFEEMVQAGRFKKRSASFYPTADRAPGGKLPALRHIGYLGAVPPAVKGLKNQRTVHFEEGDAITFEFSEGATMTEADKKAAQEEAKKSVRETVTEFLKEMFGAGKDKEEAASFSEADQQKLIDKATAAAEAKFSEELKKRDTTIEELKKKVDTQGSSTTRASIVSFCEDLQRQGKFLPAFKNMGAIEFMELLASIEDTKDTKVSVISFAEENGVEVEKKVEITPLDWFKNFLSAQHPFIQFGEKFGSLTLKGDGSQIADPKREQALRDELGLNKEKPAA